MRQNKNRVQTKASFPHEQSSWVYQESVWIGCLKVDVNSFSRLGFLGLCKGELHLWTQHHTSSCYRLMPEESSWTGNAHARSEYTPHWILVLWWLPLSLSGASTHAWFSRWGTGTIISSLVPQWCTSQPDPHLLLTAPVFHAHPSPSSEHPPPVETGLVWLPAVEMMDWWLTYGKGQGPSSKQVQSCIKYEGGKGKHALPFGGGRLDRYAVYSAHVKSPALKCYLLKTACLCVSLRPILI